MSADFLRRRRQRAVQAQFNGKALLRRHFIIVVVAEFQNRHLARLDVRDFKVRLGRDFFAAGSEEAASEALQQLVDAVDDAALAAGDGDGFSDRFHDESVFAQRGIFHVQRG